MIRPDLIFSYWLFFWTLIYAVFTPKITGLSPYVYESLNPIVGLWIAMMYEIFQLLSLWINYSSHIRILLKMALVILIIKVFPIYLLMHKKVRVVNNLFFVLGLFVIYKFYLYINHTNITKVYASINKSLHDDLNNTPLMWILSKIAGLFSSP
jgi:hypothetical protein